ncbi:MAG: phosphate/phosphite/phosphonate ABC transporter substrate-binding protein [Gammaproteobacteria bacterium]|nr:phosphate/phosphite/phosphonate ABC transporter substrate-binding protein [Gammaproteobacteria bacterium]
MSHQSVQLFKYHMIATLLVAILLLMTACDSGPNTELVNLSDYVADEELQLKELEKEQDNTTLYFGFDLRASPQEDSRQYQPFLRYLEKTTGYKFELRFTPNNSSIIDELGSGRVHFAALGAVSYIQGAEKYGIKNLVRGLNQQDKASYQSMIVTAVDSPIKNIAALNNKRFVFGSIDSTQGHLIPRILLLENNLNLSDLQSYKYTGSHQNCVEAVISLKADACGMQDTMAKEMEKRGLVKIIHASKYYPSSGIAMNQDLPAEIAARVKKALTDFEPKGRDKTGLYHWSQTEMPNGFTAAKKQDYFELRKWLINLKILEISSENDKAK